MMTIPEFSIRFETEQFDLVNNYSPIAKKNNRDESFIKELNELQFSEDIISEAFNIYKSMRLNIKRKDNRLALKCFCVYNAYRNLGIAKDPYKIAEIVGLHNTNLTKMFKIFSYENTGYKMKDINVNPLGYINDYYGYTGFRMDEINNLTNFANIIINGGKLSNEYPQDAAVGIIIYYITKIHNEKLPSKFFDYVGKEEVSYNKIVNIVGTIYNN